MSRRDPERKRKLKAWKAGESAKAEVARPASKARYFVLKGPAYYSPPDRPFSVQLLDEVLRGIEVVHFAREGDVVAFGGVAVHPGVVRAVLSRQGEGDGIFVDDVGNEVDPLERTRQMLQARQEGRP